MLGIRMMKLLLLFKICQREVDINLDVVHRDRDVRPLREVSPVASALADHQFDNYVKRVRLFVRPDLAAELKGKLSKQVWADEILAACESLEREQG